MPASIYHNNNLKGRGFPREYQEPSWMRTALAVAQQRELSPGVPLELLLPRETAVCREGRI